VFQQMRLDVVVVAERVVRVVVGVRLGRVVGVRLVERGLSVGGAAVKLEGASAGGLVFQTVPVLVHDDEGVYERG
jgi:hypothetical protein